MTVDELMTLFDRAAGAHVNVAFRHLAATDPTVEYCIQLEQDLRAELRAAIEQALVDARRDGYALGCKAERTAMQEAEKQLAQPQPEAGAVKIDIAAAAKERNARIIALIDEAEKYTSAYDGDNRKCIKTDMLNAFFAGYKFGALRPQPDAMAQACNDLSAALGWPHGVSYGPLPWVELVESVARLRAVRDMFKTELDEARAQRDALRDHPEKQPEAPEDVHHWAARGYQQAKWKP